MQDNTFTVNTELPTADENGEPVFTVIYRENGATVQVDFIQEIEADRCMSGVYSFGLEPVEVNANLAWILQG